jgi:hypothetical protein
MGLAEVVHDDVECSEEGVHVEHRSVPFPSGSVSKPTLVGGHLPLKFRVDNSHQTFKSAYGTTPEQARNALVQAWEFIFHCYAKLGRRHTGHGDVRPGRPAQRPHYAKYQEQSVT